MLQCAVCSSGQLYFYMYGGVTSERRGFEAQLFYNFGKYLMYNKQFYYTRRTILGWHFTLTHACVFTRLWLMKIYTRVFEITPHIVGE